MQKIEELIFVTSDYINYLWFSCQLYIFRWGNPPHEQPYGVVTLAGGGCQSTN